MVFDWFRFISSFVYIGCTLVQRAKRWNKNKKKKQKKLHSKYMLKIISYANHTPCVPLELMNLQCNLNWMHPKWYWYTYKKSKWPAHCVCVCVNRNKRKDSFVIFFKSNKFYWSNFNTLTRFTQWPVKHFEVYYTWMHEIDEIENEIGLSTKQKSRWLKTIVRYMWQKFWILIFF